MALILAGALALGSMQSIDDTIPADTLVTAIRVGIDPMRLHEAVLTVKTDAVTYLTDEGILNRPEPQRTAPAEPAYSVWDRLAVCESTSNWRANTGNGYYGGLQFDRQTWLAYGGGVYATTANLATRAQQIDVAERLRAARGFQPWPACRRILRLP